MSTNSTSAMFSNRCRRSFGFSYARRNSLPIPPIFLWNARKSEYLFWNQERERENREEAQMERERERERERAVNDRRRTLLQRCVRLFLGEYLQGPLVAHGSMHFENVRHVARAVFFTIPQLPFRDVDTRYFTADLGRTG